MWRRRNTPPVAASLEAQIDIAVQRVERARAELDAVIATGAPLLARRRAHAEVGAAFLEADALLRTATRSAKAHSHLAWSAWRHRLSQLDLARQQHLFEEADDPAVLAICSVRAVDTGMSGPAIGDHIHGDSKPPGATAAYGLDLEAAMTTPVRSRVSPPPAAPAAAAATPVDGDLVEVFAAGGARPAAPTADAA